MLSASCTDPQGNLRDEYLNNARKIGIVPIYPPREEFQVGDIFLTSYVVDPNDALSVWVGEATPVVHLADDFMARRLVFRTTEAGRGSTEPVASQADTFGGRLTRRGALEIETLPAAAFPSFSADEGTTGALGITRVLQALGLAGGSRTKVRLSFNDVRTYWVENAEVSRRLGGTVALAETALSSIGTAAPDILANDLCKEIVRQKAAGGRPVTDFTKRKFGGMIITRVYLTRQITYTYYNARIIAAGVRRAEPGSTAANVPDPARVSVNVNSTTGELDSAAIDSQIAALRAQLDDLGDETSQGAGINFESWDARGMTFSQNFPRPVTIGYEAINFGLPFVPPGSAFDRLQLGDPTICPGIAN